jgi:hypothetical protein
MNADVHPMIDVARGAVEWLIVEVKRGLWCPYS